MSNVYIDNLKPGMVIKEDIFTKQGQLVICKNTIATENIIRRLHYFDIINIPIYNEGEKYQTNEETFEIFKKDYSNIERQVSSFLNNLIKKEYSDEQLNNIINDTIKMYNNQSSTIMLLKMMQQIEETDPIFTHSLNVGILGMIIGKWCGMDEAQTKLILECGIFHDVGKMLMPNALLNKNDGLSINEYAEMKSHTLEGYRLLKSLDVNEEIAKVALLHHERIDGSGYPLQLKGNQIEKFSNISKIIAIADVYDAMTTKRSYRDAICPFAVFGKFERDGIKIYDAKYLITFLKNIINTYINDKVELSDGRIGKIVMINQTSLGRPIVQVENDFIDLAQYRENELSIVKILA